MAIAIVVQNWRPEEWRDAIKAQAPDLDVRVWPDQLGDVNDIEYVLSWMPPAGILKTMPNLKAIFSLGAGVDAILRDETVPKEIPLSRVVDADLTQRMTAYVTLHVLMHHREQLRLMANQKAHVWDSFATTAPAETRVGIMGFGHLGQDAGKALAMLGFEVAGWSQARKDVPGIRSYAGAGELDAFLARTDMLVVLLPHTAGTHGILNRELFRKLSRKGPLGAPVLINAGRGRLQNEADILAALDAGELAACSLDVFETEPLAKESPLWSHPRVIISPHQAADSEPATISKYVLGEIRHFEATGSLRNPVDRSRGY